MNDSIAERLLLMPTYLQHYYHKKLNILNLIGCSQQYLFPEDILKLSIDNPLYCLGDIASSNPKGPIYTKFIFFNESTLKNEVLLPINSILNKYDISNYICEYTYFTHNIIIRENISNRRTHIINGIFNDIPFTIDQFNTAVETKEYLD